MTSRNCLQNCHAIKLLYKQTVFSLKCVLSGFLKCEKQINSESNKFCYWYWFTCRCSDHTQVNGAVLCPGLLKQWHSLHIRIFTWSFCFTNLLRGARLRVILNELSSFLLRNIFLMINSSEFLNFMNILQNVLITILTLDVTTFNTNNFARGHYFEIQHLVFIQNIFDIQMKASIENDTMNTSTNRSLYLEN